VINIHASSSSRRNRIMKLQALALAALLSVGVAHAATITQWNFNSVPADSTTTTGSGVASVGTGSTILLSSVTSGFGSGSANGGSSDPVTTDDTGLQTTTYAPQGLGNKTTGVQFNVSTVGFQNITLSYDLRHSNTSARHEQVQYSLDGITFTDAALFDGNAGDTWFNGRSVDLSSIAGASNNATFAFRVVSAFAPGTSSYAAASPTGTYAGTGTWRFDMVTVSGTALPVTPAVPEPESLALLAAGLTVVGLRAVRRRRAA
jgi:PEP-CTERM motif